MKHNEKGNLSHAYHEARRAQNLSYGKNVVRDAGGAYVGKVQYDYYESKHQGHACWSGFVHHAGAHHQIGHFPNKNMARRATVAAAMEKGE